MRGWWTTPTAFTSALSVGSFTDLSADLAQLDTTNDKFNNVALDGMRLKAIKASPKIRPVTRQGQRQALLGGLAGPDAFKNLRDSIDTEVLAVTTVEMPRRPSCSRGRPPVERRDRQGSR
jgi:hypothetical protein